MSMIDLARKRKDEIMSLKNKGLSNAEVASVMRVRGCEISSGTVAKLVYSEPDKVDDISEATIAGLLNSLTDLIESGRSKRPGAANQIAKILRRALVLICEGNDGNIQGS